MKHAHTKAVEFRHVKPVQLTALKIVPTGEPCWR